MATKHTEQTPKRKKDTAPKPNKKAGPSATEPTRADRSDQGEQPVGGEGGTTAKKGHHGSDEG